MPIFKVETNLPRERIPADFGPKATAFLSDVLKKPYERIKITVNTNPTQIWAGKQDPSAQASLLRVAENDPEELKQASGKIFDFVRRELGINEDRMYLAFINIPQEYVGFELPK